jgi:hypothetical protein
MRTPHFIRLIEIDEQRFISACRHGLVHLTWGRATVRLTRDEFRSLADLLEGLGRTPPPSSAREGQIEVSARPDGDGELRVGALLLLLSPHEFQTFATAARNAVDRLDHVLASGVWDEDEEEDTPTDFGDPIPRTPFSEN